MATIPIVSTFDRRAGIISAVIAMIVLLIVILFLTYEQADPLPEDIPITLAEPLDPIAVEEIRNVVADLGGGGGGDPSESPKNDPIQVEAVLTQTNSDTEVTSGTGNTTTSTVDNGPSGNEVPNMFGGGGNGGEGSGNGPGFGPANGPGTNGTGGGNGGAGRKVVTQVSFKLDYDHVVSFRFKVTIDANGNVISAQVVKGSTTTTDQALINKVKQAVIKQVKYSKSPGSSAVVKIYNITLQPK